MEVSLANFDLLLVRNKSQPKAANGSRKRLPDTSCSTVIRLHAIVDGALVDGLGDIHTNRKAGGASPAAAFRLARSIARRLRGTTIQARPDRESVEAICNRVRGACREELGIPEGEPTPVKMAGAVLFAFDCAIIDFVSRITGTPIARILGTGPAAAGSPNMHAASLSDPEKLASRLATRPGRQGWIRGRFRQDEDAALALIMAVDQAMAGRPGDIDGLILNLEGRWSPDAVATLSRRLAATESRSGLQVKLENPCPRYAFGYYQDLVETLAHKGGDQPTLRLLLDWPFPPGSSSASAILSSVDVCVSPQQAGGFFEAEQACRLAVEAGLEGAILIDNPGRNGCVATAATAALSALSGARIIHESTVQTAIGTRVCMPREGSGWPSAPGWGVDLCRSGLKRRVDMSAFVHEGGEVDAVGRKILLEGLALMAYDDTGEIRSAREARSAPVREA